MPYRKHPLSANHYYHIFNRGNNKQNIFYEAKNYLFLLKRIRENILEFSDLVAYCLMPNHYHFIIKIINPEKFSSGIKRTFISYSKAINANYNRSGHLFEGRYKYRIIPNDEYLLHLSRYIHLNPVRAKLVNNPGEWLHSSYKEYIGERNIKFIKPEIILSQIKDYHQFVESYQAEQQYHVKELIF